MDFHVYQQMLLFSRMLALVEWTSEFGLDFFSHKALAVSVMSRSPVGMPQS